LTVALLQLVNILSYFREEQGCVLVLSAMVEHDFNKAATLNWRVALI